MQKEIQKSGKIYAVLSVVGMFLFFLVYSISNTLTIDPSMVSLLEVVTMLVTLISFGYFLHFRENLLKYAVSVKNNQMKHSADLIILGMILTAGLFVFVVLSLLNVFEGGYQTIFSQDWMRIVLGLIGIAGLIVNSLIMYFAGAGLKTNKDYKKYCSYLAFAEIFIGCILLIIQFSALESFLNGSWLMFLTIMNNVAIVIWAYVTANNASKLK